MVINGNYLVSLPPPPAPHYILWLYQGGYTLKTTLEIQVGVKETLSWQL